MKYIISFFFGLSIAIFSANLFADVAHIEIVYVANSKSYPPNLTDFSEFSLPTLAYGSAIFSEIDSRQRQSIETNAPGVVVTLADNVATKIPFAQINFSNFGALTLNNQLAAFIGYGPQRVTGIYSVNFLKQVNLIVDNNTPLTNGNGNFVSFAYPYLFNDGSIAFYAKGNGKQSGIYYANAKGLLNNWISTHTVIPQGNSNFIDFLMPAFSAKANNTNDFVFIGLASDQQTAIYEDNQGKLSLIVSKINSIPNSAVGNFTKFDEVSFDAANDSVAFIGEGILGQIGVYQESNGSLTKAVDLQDAIPAGLGNFTGFSHISLDNDMIAFEGTGNFNQQGVFLNAPQGVFKILTNSDQIGNKKVKQVNISNYALANNQIAMRVIFQDGSSGIYLANVQILPY